ncbi:putative polyketide synthase [Apodospora peruviana]|uniref:Polyketide synthase n=1 Tax=Apodospora peruviana TaxID=516989 RepID=A0AAE0M1Y5_9PEZI|nr:putative polyketide synthase [Apodospora peruviana]
MGIEVSEPVVDGQMNGHTNGHPINRHPEDVFVDDRPSSNLNGTNGMAAASNGVASGTASSNPRPTNPITPIAIIGMACRLSGDVSSAEELWQLCSRARSGWSPIPKDRWSQQGYYHPNASRTGTYNAEGGHFIQEDVGLFDAPFFNISATEARSIDPQQRLLLECTYEALENAGVPKETVVGKNVGVFVGGSFSDYSLFCLRDADTVPAYEATGTAQSVLSNRLSYYFDLKGPSVTVDTACSSTLSALHLACQSLRSGESSQAIVGGSHLNLVPEIFISMSNSRLLSKSGKCFSFDDRAEGFGRGEGLGCIVLKNLDDAIRDGDRIRAVIRSTGMNQDGRTQGISMPNGAAQAELIRSVYESAGLDVNDTGYVEAHGTGTKVGDPIEAAALHSVFGPGRSPKDPLYIGSVKSNVGHAEGSSGIVAVIKTALMLEKGFILPNTNYKRPNDAIPLAEWNMKVPKTQIPWPRKKRFASINNFGFGGTNCHVVLEGPPKPSKADRSNMQKTNGATNQLLNGMQMDTLPVNKLGIASHKIRFLFVLSANSEKSVKAQMQGLQMYLEQRPETLELSVMGKLAYTLCQRRSLLTWKVAVSATTSSELISKLSNPDLRPVSAFDAPRVSFVFTGQGAQWYGMGRELLRTYPVFASAIEMADEYLRSLGAEWSLTAELLKDADYSLVDQPYISQPACTAIQIALVRLLSSWGIHPAAVVGHSSGEIAAAFAAGVLSLKACMKIAYHRGLAAVEFKKKYADLTGSMMAVGASPEDVEPLLKTLKSGRAVVACINSPSSITISGDEAAITELQPLVEEKGFFNRKLRVGMAYHSHHMELMADDYLASMKDIQPRKSSGSVRFFSSVTGLELDTPELGASYWVKNLVSPVQFTQALRSMCLALNEAIKISSQQSNSILVEIGPHGALEGPVKQTLKAAGAALSSVEYAPTLIRNKNAVEAMHQLGATLCTRGQRLDFETVNFPRSRDKTMGLLTDLPRYPWQHTTRYWHQSRIGDNHRFIRQFPRNDILGALADDSNDLEPRWRNVIRLEDMPWLRDHQIQSNIVFPMAGYVTMAMEAAFQRATQRNVKFDRYEFREISANRALLIKEATEVETMITLRPYNEGTKKSTDAWDEFRIFAWAADQGWVEHCRGLVGVQKDKSSSVNAVDGQRQIDARKEFLKTQTAMMEEKCNEVVDIDRLAANLKNLGVYYGPAFQSFVECRTVEQLAVAEVELADTAATMPQGFEPELIVHPAHLDLIIQILWPLLGAGRAGWDKIYMPSGFKRLSISPKMAKVPGSRLRVYGSSPPISPMVVKPVELNVFAMQESDPDDACVVLEGYTITPVAHDTSNFHGSNAVRDLCFKLDWEPIHLDSVTAPALSETDIVIISSESWPLVSGLQRSLEELTGKTPLVVPLKQVQREEKVYIMLEELTHSLLDHISPEDFALIQKLCAKAKGILWAVQGAYQDSDSPTGNMAVGLARTIRAETALKFATIDLDQHHKAEYAKSIDAIISVVNSLSSADSTSSTSMEYMLRSGALYIPRVIKDDEMNKFVHQQQLRAGSSSEPEPQPFGQKGRPLKMAISSPGLLDTLHFIDDYTLSSALPAEYIEIEVKAVGLNFKDVMIAMGHLANEHIGIECSGVVTQVGNAVPELKVGDRVCAIAEGSFASRIRCRATSAHRLPDSLSFEAACTLPVVWSTALYSLSYVARLEKGESVLIHAAAGGVGQAAIILAQMLGADKIFLTVGSADKKQYLMDTYGIPETQIFYSRDTSFAQQIQAATNGLGVDVILNSLAGDSLLASWTQCLAPFGRFVEIGKRDIVNNTRLEMAPLAKNVTFSSVDLVVVLAERPKMMQRILRDVFDLYGKGTVRPITPLSTYAISDVETAFRSLQSGKNLGKIAITLEEEDIVKAVPPKMADTLFRDDATYVIVGGTGGLGRSMTRWMATKGAKHVVLASRSAGRVSDSVKSLISDLAADGTEVVVSQCDVAKEEDVKRLVAEISSRMPPIRGVIHSAMVLNDILFEKMSFDNYDNVVQPKVAGAWNLHKTLANHQLDFFIMLSSAAGIVGNRGQAAYSAANTFMNAFAQYRVRRGLPATAIDLAAVTDVGYLAENDAKKDLVMGSMGLGSEGVNEAELHALIAAVVSRRMKSNHCITGLDIPPGSPTPEWMLEPKFAPIRPQVDAAAKITTKLSLRQSLKQADSIEEAEALVYAGLVDKVSAILAIPKDDIDGRQPIAAYGLDSLVAVEIRNWVTRQTDVSLQVLELLSSGSLIALSALIVKKSALVDPKLFGEGAEGDSSA